MSPDNSTIKMTNSSTIENVADDRVQHVIGDTRLVWLDRFINVQLPLPANMKIATRRISHQNHELLERPQTTIRDRIHKLVKDQNYKP